MNRREVLTLMSAAAMAAPALAFAAKASLGEAAAAKGIRFGSATGIVKGGLRDPEVVKIILRDCKILVPRNELKMYTLRNKPEDVYDFSLGDEMVSFCQAHALPLRGHTLFWAKDEFLPKWLLTHDFGPNPKLAAETMLRDYIGRVASHFGSRLTSWDVINEAIDEKTGDIRANVFTRILGEDVLRICFETARDHLPHMQLVYNDYMTWGANNATHRAGVLKVLRWFREQKIPVDALGIQGHIGTEQGPGKEINANSGAPQYGEWTRFLEAAAGLDYTLMVTEFDVNDRKVEGDITKRDAVVAEVAKTYIDLTLDNKAVKDFLCWGLDDKYSWLQTTTPRADKLPLRPTPYDDQFAPKPLYAAMMAAFKAAPQRG
jgi:endo-1,4-beta-xylanase